MRSNGSLCSGGSVSRAVTRTRGLPSLAMMKLSPFAAWSTGRDRWVLASWMFTVGTAAIQTN